MAAVASSRLLPKLTPADPTCELFGVAKMTFRQGPGARRSKDAYGVEELHLRNQAS